MFLYCERSIPISTTKKTDQHIWKEILVSPELFSATPEYSEDLTEEEGSILKEAKLLVGQLLFDRVIALVSANFTDHQKKVLALAQMPDKTYNEIAEILDINYTGVSHAIKGIKSPKHGKYHGGFEKKLRKVCLKDSQCKRYLECITTLRENDPHRALEILIELDPDKDFWISLRK